MDLSYGAAAEEFRGEVRAFLSANWQPGERRGNELKDYVRDFRRQGVEAGYLYRAVPRAYGGSEQPVDVIAAVAAKAVAALPACEATPDLFAAA